MPFEVFTARKTRSVTVPYFTIQQRGNFSLNRLAYEMLGEPQAVELLYDRVDHIIGLRPIDPSEKHAYPVRRQQNSASYVVSGHSFCSYYSIPTEITRKYTAVINDGMLTADLKTEAIEDPSPRARAHATTETGD
jgi:hypothetical protein